MNGVCVTEAVPLKLYKCVHACIELNCIVSVFEEGCVIIILNCFLKLLYFRGSLFFHLSSLVS